MASQTKTKPKKTVADEFVAALVRSDAIRLDEMVGDLYPEDYVNGFGVLAEPVIERGSKLSEAELFNALQKNKEVQSIVKKLLKRLTNCISTYAYDEFQCLLEDREEMEQEMEWERRDNLETEKELAAERKEEEKDRRKEAARKAILKDPALSKKDKAKAKKAFEKKDPWCGACRAYGCQY